MSTPPPWKKSMQESRFEFMKSVLAAPSPVGLEGGMTYGVIKPEMEGFMLPGWKIHTFRGNAGIVLDTAPERTDLLSVMFLGHADKIRMQVRSIGEDGKIWINSDSFLPTTLIGHEVVLYSENPDKPGEFRALRGGTVEALGAIHFAKPALRRGDTGIKSEMLYLELQIHGDDKKGQVQRLGIRPGDVILLDRPIRRGFSPDTFYGAYLDDGLGCFVTTELARMLAERGGLKNVRVLFGISTGEEIGRMGSRVLAGTMRPDVLVAVDVNHDYRAAPGVKDRRFPPLEMGRGFTLGVGAVVSEQLNAFIQTVAREKGIPLQMDVVGRDTGTDTMAAVFAAIDAAATTIGFPVRNMHTISETACTGDVLAAIHVLDGLLDYMDNFGGGAGLKSEDLRQGHARLDSATALLPSTAAD